MSIFRLGLCLDEPLLFISSGREELYIEITSFPTKSFPTKLFRFLQKIKRVFVFVGGLRFRRCSFS